MNRSGQTVWNHRRQPLPKGPLAPELKPRTSGPARGFLKRVCINSPPRARAPPPKMQVNALVSLKSIMMSDQEGFVGFPPVKMVIVWRRGIRTLPRETFSKKRMTISVGNTTHQYFFRIFFIRFLLQNGQWYCFSGFLVKFIQGMGGYSKNFKTRSCYVYIVSYLCSPFWATKAQILRNRH